ncbi:MAG: hypothetical protein Q9199_004248 [Rusavskia elegans]
MTDSHAADEGTRLALEDSGRFCDRPSQSSVNTVKPESKEGKLRKWQANRREKTVIAREAEAKTDDSQRTDDAKEVTKNNPVEGGCGGWEVEAGPRTLA